MSGAQICVIRRFQSKDEPAVKEIIQEVAMERLNDFVFGIVLSQSLVQIAVTFTAILFIVFGVPLQFALIAFPLTVGVIYFTVYMGHVIKVTELQDDLSRISGNYMTSNNTCFYVAELYIKSDGTDVYAMYSNKVKKVEYEFVTEKEFEVKTFNLSGLTPVIGGCVGVTKAFYGENRAQVRRFAVTKRFRRRQLGNELLKTAVKFSKERKYDGVQAVTTEYHKEAFELFAHGDFDIMPIGYKSYMFFDEVKQISVYHSFAPKKNSYMDENIAEGGEN